ncbi:MAG: hypothetical protein AB1515_03825 [Nitrospirota bacterium]
MMEEVARGVYQWSRYSEEKGLNFNGHLIASEREHVIIDPPLLSDEEVAFVQRLGLISSIIVTNRDHVREADRYRSLFRTKILAPALDAPMMEIRADGVFNHGDRLAGELLVIQIPDGKSPGESALLLERDAGILILGDALIGRPPGALSLLPPDKFADAGKAKAGLATLLGYAFDAVLVGDGVSVLVDGKKAVRRAIET